MKVFTFRIEFGCHFLSCSFILTYLYASVQTVKPELIRTRILWVTQRTLNEHSCLEVGHLSFQARLTPDCLHVVRGAKAISAMGQKV